MRDLARAEAFYSGVLGLAVIRRWDDEAGSLRSIWCALGGEVFLAIERVAGAGAARGDDAPGWHCVALRIARADRERWRERLALAGYPVERESAFTLYVRDPDGALVALSHHPEAVDD